MEDHSSNSENKNYKFKELRVYASTEWLADNKKKYRQVFDRYETTYIYAELSFYNKQFDRDNWDVNVELRCYETKNLKKQICALKFKKKISKFDNIVYIREGWGNKKDGSFWKKGTYFWESWLEGEKVGTKYFYIEDIGQKSISSLYEPYIKISSIKLYEGQYDDVIEEDRTYLRQFSEEETKYVYVEIFLENLILNSDWHCEMFVKFYNESKELKGQVVRLQSVKSGESIIKITAGWGANAKGSWKDGLYHIEIVFMDRLIATVQFLVSDHFEEGMPDVKLMGRFQSSAQEVDVGEQFNDVFERLDKLVGLQDLKNKVFEHTKYLEFLKLRKSKGFKEAEKINIHSVFLGNPGTGKTTVAKMMGQLYRKMGLLSKGHVVEADRGDLVGEYIGQTAPKTKEIIEKARGGVLFIDEAYSLARANDDSKDFGREVVEILVKEMSNGRGDLAVVVAGYPKEMKHFIQSNPGLKSRFKHFFEFSDYLPQDLIKIAQASGEEKEIVFTPESFKLLSEMIVAAYRDRDRTFGNARFVHDLLDKAKVSMALRLMSRKKPDKLSKVDLSTIQLSDVLAIKSKYLPTHADIPIDEQLLQETMEALDRLIGIASIKTQIKELVDIVRYHRESGKNVVASISLHTVLVGNPGTGKNTVARLLAKIYKALGLLERGHLVETDRQGLVAGFVGQTAIKTSEKIEEALGGVLFIDEAYSLSNFNGLQGDFGHEVIQTLIKKMEDLRGQFFVFVAGYPENMDVFLKANPGLSSRFDKTFKFNDYTPLELEQIAFKMMKDEGYTLSPKANESLKKTMSDIFYKRDKYFGNARTVRKLVTEMIKNHNLRISTISPELRKKSQATVIMNEDLLTISTTLENQLMDKKTIGFGNHATE